MSYITELNSIWAEIEKQKQKQSKASRPLEQSNHINFDFAQDWQLNNKGCKNHPTEEEQINTSPSNTL